MKPLRLQIVVQPRQAPSPSPSASTASEPIVKWLEICYTDPTIQELCDTLEARFFQRNHVPLNIKILKYGDDLELFPDGKVRDIFSDINDPVASDKSKCTVKVYRNPPTSAELADPQRFESLPPNSLARPRKRPLPPTFSSAVRDDYHGLVDHGHPLRPFSPVQPYGNDKRQKVEAFSSKSYFNPDRPLDSLETRNGYYHPLPIAPQRPSPGRHAAGTQKRKRESPKVSRANMSTELFQGSDPYGTPVSSQTVPQGLDKPQETEIISVPDSPVSGHDLFDHALSRFPSIYGSTRPKSPELPTFASRSSNSGQASSDVPFPIIPPLPDQEHKIEKTANATKHLMSLQAAKIQSPVPQEPANNHSTAKYITENAPKTPSPNLEAIANQLGQLQRPKSAKRSPASKRTRKVINGVRQKTPSVFDPIETSEGSTYEREQLRSAKRSKLTRPPQPAPKSKEMQATTNSRSPGGQFLLPNVHQSNVTAASTPEASDDHVPPKSCQEPEASSQEGTQSDNFAELAEQPALCNIIGRKTNKSDVSEDPPDMEHCGKALESNADKFPSASRQSPEHNVLEQQEEEEQQAKRKAQADFDRIAAMRSEKKSNQARTKADPAAIEDSSANHGAGQESEPSISDLFAGLQAPPELTFQERREWNLKHLVPVRDKYLKERKAESQAWKKQERTAQAETQRQQKQARAQKMKAAKKPTQKADAEDEHATEKQAEAEVADTKERRIAELQVQDKEDKIHELKSKVGRAQPTQQVKATKANLADFPQPTRIKTKQLSQRKVTSSEDTAEERAQKENETAMEIEMEANGVSLQGRSQEASACAGLSKETSTTEHLASTVMAQDVKPATTQGVCKSDQSWLSDRSPKAKYNAARQLQLANERLKQTKRNSMVVPVPPAMAKPTSSAPTPDTSAPAQKVQPRKKDVKKQRGENQNGVQHRRANAGTFNDSDALKAAGISAKMPATSTARKDTVRHVKPTKSTHADGIAPGRSQLHGILKAAEAKSSSPAPERSEFIRNRSMTPAFPSSSNRNSVSSAGAKVGVPRRAATVAPESLKSSARSGLRASTPVPSQRSVSFANRPSSPSPSHSQNSSANPTTHASGAKKGMLYRALEESNAKRAEDTNQRAKSTSARSTATVNKITKPPTRVKQTKMTQHLDRDPKGKGKAVVEERLVYLSSSDEAASYFSSESEGERGGRAGPSSRKKTKHGTKPIEADDNTSEKRPVTSGKPANKPEGQSIKVKSKNSGPDAASSDKTIRVSSSSSSSYSDSEAESALGQTDDVALLPQVHASSSTLAGPSQRSSQKSRTVAKVSSPPDLRSSLMPEPGSTPNNRTHDARMARLSEEQRMSQEAARQLRREHMEAVRKESIEEGLLSTNNPTASGQSTSSSQRPTKRAANGGYEETSLSKLRQAQAATKLAVMPKPATFGHEARPKRSQPSTEPSTSGDSDSSSTDTDQVDQIQVTQPQSQGPFTPKKNRLGRVFKELWGPSR